MSVSFVRRLFLVALTTIAAVGSMAHSQITITSADRRVLMYSCANGETVQRETSALGRFDAVIVADYDPPTQLPDRASHLSMLSADEISGTISTSMSILCGNSSHGMSVHFTVLETQRWHISWTFDSSAEIELHRLNGQDPDLRGPVVDTVLTLIPGDYFFFFSYSTFGNAAGVFNLTHIPPETSEQITFQGVLNAAGVPYTGVADLRFSIFDAPTGGVQIGSLSTIPAVQVSDGKFAATFIANPSDLAGNPRWLQIDVRSPEQPAFQPLAQRQPLTAAPYAHHARSSITASSAMLADFAAAADSATSAQNAVHATTATSATTADHAISADLATAALAVPYSGITSNPWILSGATIRTSSMVGIGKVPVDALDVQGNIRINDGTIMLRGTGDNNHGLGWFGAGKPFASLTPDGPVLFGFSGGILGTRQGGDRAVLTWNNSAQVGINTTNTQGFTLAVNGSAGKPGGGSWSVLSDPRTKTNIRPLTGTLDRLLSLPGYEFNYKPEFVNAGCALPGTQIGLLASEVQQVFPDWIETGSDGLMRVTERSTTALMVEALRELRDQRARQIADLRARLEALESARAGQGN